MSIVLGPNQYGKAETRVVRVIRDGPVHIIRDLNVSTMLRGDFAAAHVDGDQANVLPTDTQKNTCYAFASKRGIGEIEDFALSLARHFVTDIEPVLGARVDIDEYAWDRIQGPGAGHPHAFVRSGPEVRTTAVTVQRDGDTEQAWVISGLKDLVVLKTAGSEFGGFLRDGYTTLQDTSDRILATSLTAQWRFGQSAGNWADTNAEVRDVLLERFANVHSLALQQSLWEMGKAVLEARPDIDEIRLSAPNKHHFLVDLSPFGLANPGEVFHADDRPYGLIQCAVLRDEAGPAGPAWDSAATFG
jgi:urate oxidase